MKKREKKKPTNIFNFSEPAEKGVHHISFMYYTLAGFLVTGVATLVSSLFFGFNDTSAVDRNLIAPFIHKFMEPSKYDTVEMNENWLNKSKK